MEEELKKAYETLGLEPDATREQVENRYFILLKRERAQQKREHDAAEDGSGSTNLEAIHHAYRIILGLESGKISTEPKQGKVAHFFYYYKVHLIVGIIILLFAGYTIKETIDKRNEEARLGPVDLAVAVVGNYYFADMELLQQNMLKLVPEWNRIKSTLTYIPTEIKSEQDIALQQKSVLTIMTEHDEIYFLDQKNFESLVYQEAFRKLDELPGFGELGVAESRIVYATTETEEPNEAAYGIDVTDHPIFQGIELTGERAILAVRADDDELPKTMELLSQIVKSIAQ